MEEEEEEEETNRPKRVRVNAMEEKILSRGLVRKKPEDIGGTDGGSPVEGLKSQRKGGGDDLTQW